MSVVDGRRIGFWTFKWYGNQPFKDLYPNLFAKEAVYDVSIVDRLPAADLYANGVWQWSNPLFEEEQQQLNDLITLLVGFPLCPDRPDSWRWIPGTAGIFSVKSCYSFLLQTRQAKVLDADVLDALKNLWRNDVSSKVLVFGWRLLLERLPTRGALSHRGILTSPNDLHCIFCLHHIEDCEHLFFNCSFIKNIWEIVYQWIGRSVVTGAAVANGRHHFSRFGNLFRYPKGGRVNHLIWLATIWCVWNLRNQVVSKRATPIAFSLVDDIKTFS
ncbi:hypothetical protein QL285_020433 [Trifolium repens]|nr:hypothetical protein QL285_020433 [Trifolium repens]